MERSPAPTLRTLLARRELRLLLISDERALAPGALDQPMRWVHGTDLADPTPFLADDLVLLTTGTQFAPGARDAVDIYVTRLVQRGVNGLGFGSGVHSQGIPPELIAACAEHRLALFEVPYDVPFIAIARAHAEGIAAQAYSRRTWALETQRALAIAALRPRGLESALTELSKRLGCWVGQYDASGVLVHEHPIGGGSTAAKPADAVTALLERGTSASRTVEDASGTHTLFTLGRTGHLRGVIAIGTAAHDAETRAVATSVIAMAGLALEQGESLARERRRLNTQLLASLLTDDPALARRVRGSLPAAPIVVGVCDASRSAAVMQWWDRRRTDGAAVFLAEGQDEVSMCVSAQEEDVFDQIAMQLDLRIGVSSAADYRAFSQAHSQALSALHRGRTGASGTGASGTGASGTSAAGAGVVRFAETAGGGVLDALASDEARVIATARLAPLRAHDAATGAELERSLRLWLEHDARLEAAAAAMGVHRHTMRTRIGQVARLLETDLSSFPARAELWAALRMTA